MSSQTQSTSTHFLYVDETIEIVNISGLNQSFGACQSVSSCRLSASGGSSLRLELKNFPYTTASEVNVLYSSRVASVSEFTQTVDSATSTTFTEMVLSFQSAVAAGTHQVAVRSSSYQVAYFNVQFQPALQVSRFSFSNSLASEILLQLNGRIGRINGQQLEHAFACSDVIVDAAAQLGTNECYFTNNRSAIVGRMQHSLGTLTPGSTITINADSVESDDSLSVLGASTMTVERPDEITAPTAVLTAPTMVDLCQASATLKGSTSYGAGIVQYSWSSPSSASLDTFLTSQSSEASVVELESNQLPSSGESVQVCLTVSDYFSSSVASCTSIQRVNLPMPTVEILTDTSLAVDKVNLLRGQGTFSACVGRQTLAYNWGISPAIDTSDLVTNQKILQLKKGLLAPNTQYEFSLQAWAISAPSNVALAMITVQTNFPDLRCQITGSGGDASSIEQLVLDASGSQDPLNEQVELSWSCSQLNSAGVLAPCRDISGNEIKAIQSETFGVSHVAAHTFPATEQAYTWVATIIAAASNRAKSCQVSYQMKAQKVLRVEMAVPTISIYKQAQYQDGVTSDGQLYNFLANTDQKLQVSCTVPVDTSSTEHISFSWSVAGNYLDLVLPEPITDSTPSTRSSLLNLPPNTFSPGQIAALTCSATGASVVGSSTFSVLGNEIPSGGSCVITPTAGVRVTTTFKASCLGFADTTSAKLWYAFKYTSSDGTEKQLRSSLQTNEFEFILDDSNGGDLTVTAVVFDEVGAYATRDMQLTLSASQPTVADLESVVESKLKDSTATGQSEETNMLVECCATAAEGVNNATSGNGRRLLVDVSSTANLTQQLLEALDTSSQSQITNADDAQVLLQSLSSTIHTVALNYLLSSSQLIMSSNILQRTLSGLSLLTSPTISSTTGSHAISVIADLVMASAAVDNSTQGVVASTLESAKDSLATIGGSMLSIGEAPATYGSQCQFMQISKKNPTVAVSRYELQSSCANFDIPYSALSPSAVALSSITLAIGSVPPFRTSVDAASPFGNFTSSMIDLSIYATSSKLELTGLKGASQINISVGVQDNSQCAAIRWNATNHSWTDSGVACVAQASSSDRRLLGSSAGTVTLQSESTGTVAAIHSTATTAPTQVPTSAPVSAVPTVAPTAAPTAPSPTPEQTYLYQVSTPLSYFDNSTSGQHLRTSLGEAFAQVAELDVDQVSIESITSARRTGVVVQFIVTGTPSSNLQSAMTSSSSSGFAAAFVLKASAYGITIAQPVIALVETSIPESDSSESFLGFSMWMILAFSAGSFVLLLAAAIGMYRCRSTAPLKVEKSSDNSAELTAEKTHCHSCGNEYKYTDSKFCRMCGAARDTSAQEIDKEPKEDESAFGFDAAASLAMPDVDTDEKTESAVARISAGPHHVAWSLTRNTQRMRLKITQTQWNNGLTATTAAQMRSK